MIFFFFNYWKVSAIVICKFLLLYIQSVTHIFIMFYEKRKGSYVGRIILNQFYCEYKGILLQRHDALQQEKSFVERMFKIEVSVE